MESRSCFDVKLIIISAQWVEAILQDSGLKYQEMKCVNIIQIIYVTAKL